jgi:hypothetical protein
MRVPELSIFRSRRLVNVRTFLWMSGTGVSTFSAMWHRFLSMLPLRLLTKSHLRIAAFSCQSQLIIFHPCPSLYRFFCAISTISIRIFGSFEAIDDQYFSNYQVLVSSTFHARSESSRVRIWVCYVTGLRSFYFANWTVPSSIEMITQQCFANLLFLLWIFDLFWKLQFWFQFISWFNGISRRRLLLQQWKQMILPVFI